MKPFPVGFRHPSAGGSVPMAAQSLVELLITALLLQRGVSTCHCCSSHLITSQMEEQGRILKVGTKSELELISLK